MNKKLLIAASLSVVLLNPPHGLWAGSGIFETYGIFSSLNNSGASLLNQYYDMQATTANPNFNENNFGVFNINDSNQILQLKGGEVKTFKNGLSDVFSATLFYRVFETSVGAGSLGFANLNLPWSSNLPTTGDQSWSTTGSSISLLGGSVVADKSYTIEVYFEANTSDGIAYSNAGGANYKATFSTVPEPSSASLMALGTVGLLALRRRRSA